jgi:uncharacterized protein YcnI
MRIRWLWMLLLTAFLVVVTGGVAWAHVTVSPKEVPADSYQVLVVRAPTEKDIPTTGIRVEVPEGLPSPACGRCPAGRASSRRMQALSGR